MIISRMGRRLPLLVAGKMLSWSVTLAFSHLFLLKINFILVSYVSVQKMQMFPMLRSQSTKNFIQPLSTQIYNDAITAMLTTDDCKLYF